MPLDPIGIPPSISLFHVLQSERMHIHAFLTCASCRCRRPGKLMSLLKITARRAVCPHTYRNSSHSSFSRSPENLDFVHDISSPSSSPHNPHQRTYPDHTQAQAPAKKKDNIPIPTIYLPFKLPTFPPPTTSFELSNVLNGDEPCFVVAVVVVVFVLVVLVVVW